jgi:hypothetical protein
MKISTGKFLVNVFIALLSLSAMTSANAQRHWHGGWGWGFGTGFVGGAYVGSQIARPYYYQPYPPPIVYPQPTIVQVPAPVYVTPPPGAQNLPVTPPPVSKQSTWFFCESANNFYPNVATCPEGWKPMNTNASSAYVPETPPTNN